MFDWKKPTVQMLGRWQPWHDGHQELFKRCIKKTGQVIIQVRDVQGTNDKNPFDWDTVCKNIEKMLKPALEKFMNESGFVKQEEIEEIKARLDKIESMIKDLKN